MLYDPKWDQTTEQKNRLTLIALLRDQSKWPAGFAWNFQSCSTCAIGLAFKTHAIGMIDEGRQYIEPVLGLTQRQGIDIFAPHTLPGGLAEGYGLPRREVTPEMVADKLEAVHLRLS